MNTIYQSETKNKTIERLSNLKSDQKGLWGKMNVSEMLAHVSDGFRTPLEDRKPTPNGNFLMHSLGKFMVMNMPFPKNAATHPETDPQNKGTKPESFEKEKQKLITILDRFQQSKNGTLAKTHPTLGKLSHEQWGKLMTKHVDHHFRQFGI
jgi:hypothetical protein